MKTTYTIGELLRLGLLKNHQGQPYKDRPTITRILLANFRLKKVKTPFGDGYSVTQAQIDKLNKRWKQ